MSRFERTKLKGEGETLITFKATAEELELLAALASDQLFRHEFIDPKLPGYKADPAQLQLGKALVVRLRALTGHGVKNGRIPVKGSG